MKRQLFKKNDGGKGAHVSPCTLPGGRGVLELAGTDGRERGVSVLGYSA